jgi:diguanylate cyclase (GGDEF)-like protein
MSEGRETTNTHSTTAPHPRPEIGRAYLMVIAGAQIGELHKLGRARTIVGRSPETHLRLDEPGVSREHAELFVESGRVTVRDLGSTNGTLVNGAKVEKRELRDGDKVSIGTSTLLLFTHHDGIEAPYQRGRAHAAVHDGATAALRRQLFLDRLAQEISFSRRHDAPLALLVWEVDGHAALEDRLGPAMARDLLVEAVRAMHPVVREDDVLAALGPGRFAVACPQTSPETARAQAERIRAAVAEGAYEAGDSELRLTVSVGVVPSPAGTDRVAVAASALVRAAENALAQAREGGGNRVAG